jgi:hypothetical protein
MSKLLGGLLAFCAIAPAMAAAPTPADCKREYFGKLDELENEIEKGKLGGITAQQRTEALAAFRERRIIASVLPKRLREKLQAARKKYKRKLEDLCAQSEDKEVQADAVSLINALEEEAKILPAQGRYLAQTAKPSALTSPDDVAGDKLYDVRHAKGGFRATLVPDPNSKVISAEGTFAWDQKNFQWSGNLTIEIVDNGMRISREGVYVLTPVDEKHLEGSRPVHVWRVRDGKNIGSVRQDIVWEWQDP